MAADVPAAAEVPVARPPSGGGRRAGGRQRANAGLAVPLSAHMGEAPAAALMAEVALTDPDVRGPHPVATRDGFSSAPPGNRAMAGAVPTAILPIVDLVAALLSFCLVGYFFARSATAVAKLVPGLLGTAAAMAAMRLVGLYRSRCCAPAGSHLWRIAVSALCGGAVLAVTEMPSAPAWNVGAMTTASAVVGTGIGRWLYERYLRAGRARGRYVRHVLLVGSGSDAAALRTTLQSEPALGYAVAGVVAGPTVDPSLSDLPLARGVSDIPRLAARTGASGVMVVPYGLSGVEVERAIAAAADSGLHVQVWPGLRGIGTTRLRRAPISGEPFFYVEPRLSAPWQLAVKRAIDVVGALVGLTLAAPALAVGALMVKLNDGGPVFHRGERVGRNGKPIYPIKLRTMVTDAHLSQSTLRLINQRTDGPLFKSSVDPRVTRVGRVLRATSIDELPQLWTVLKGTMSLVGPRPALPDEVAAFDPDLLRRHSVRPGITGLWQVEARHNPSFNAYRRLDLRYVDNWSLSLDLWILVSTVPAVLSDAWGVVRDRRRGQVR